MDLFSLTFANLLTIFGVLISGLGDVINNPSNLVQRQFKISDTNLNLCKSIGSIFGLFIGFILCPV